MLVERVKVSGLIEGVERVCVWYLPSPAHRSFSFHFMLAKKPLPDPCFQTTPSLDGLGSKVLMACTMGCVRRGLGGVYRARTRASGHCVYLGGYAQDRVVDGVGLVARGVKPNGDTRAELVLGLSNKSLAGQG